MRRLEAALEKRGVAYQRLALDYAFHSAAMDPIGIDLVQALSGLEMRAAALPMYSSVTGDRVGPNAIDAAYWWRNVRDPVRFEAAIRAMMDAGVNTFVEIGPRAVLTAYLTEIAKPLGDAASILPSLTRKEAGGARLSDLVTELELSGGLRDRTRMFPVQGRCVDLPHYPWQRERYWYPTTAESQGRLARHIVHPLLGYAVAGDALHWENHLDLAAFPLYADHVVGGGAVLPASGFVEMALAAGRERRRLEQRAQYAPQVIEDLEIVAPLLLESEHSITVRLRVDAGDGRFTIVSRERLRDDPWRTHATGRLVEDCIATSVAPLQTATRPPDVTADAHYAFAARLGLHYGPAFRSVESVWYRREGVLGAISTPPDVSAETSTTLLHPAYLDGAFQLLADLALRDERHTETSHGDLPAFLPVRLDRLELLQPHARVAAALAAPADSGRRSRRSMRADFTLYDASDAPIALVQGVRFRAVAIQTGTAQRARWIATRAVPMPRRDPYRATPLPSVGEFAQRCAARLHAPERQAARRRFSQEFEPLLDALCTSFAAKGLRELAGDQPIEPRKLIESGRIAATSASMLRNLLQLLVEDGVLQEIGTQWLWRTEVTLPEPDEIWRSLITDYPEYAPLTARVGSAGLRLAERLRAGTHDGLVKGSHAGTLSTWADACTQQQAGEVAEALADALRDAVAALAPHARLRILRVVGASPAEGPALMPLLDADRCDVVIGTATQALFDDLRGRWPAIGTLANQIVDLDRDSPTVDSPGGGFDLIVLGEGVADAPDPARRLRNARRLLLDHGQLVMLERHASRATDLIFGLEPHWWETAIEADSTVRSRLHAPQTWREALARAGFEAVEAVHDIPNAPSGPFVLIAQADQPQRAPVQPQLPTARTWLIARDGAGYSAELGVALGSALACSRSTHRDGHFRADLSADRFANLCFGPEFSRTLGANCSTTLHECGEEPHAWIHLAGLDLATASAPPSARTAAQELRAAIFTAWLQSCVSLRHRPGKLGRCRAGWDGPAAGTAHGTAAGYAPQIDRLRDAALWGIARVAMQEFADQRIRWLDLLDPLPCSPNAANLAQEMLAPDAGG